MTTSELVSQFCLTPTESQFLRRHGIETTRVSLKRICEQIIEHVRSGRMSESDFDKLMESSAASRRRFEGSNRRSSLTQKSFWTRANDDGDIDLDELDEEDVETIVVAISEAITGELAAFVDRLVKALNGAVKA